MSAPKFTMEPGRYYAWQMLPGYGETAYFSPIKVGRVTPLKLGNGSFELDFVNCFYAEGVQDFVKRLRTLKRTADYLVAEELEIPDRTVIIARMTPAWFERHARGTTPEAFEAYWGRGLFGAVQDAR